MSNLFEYHKENTRMPSHIFMQKIWFEQGKEIGENFIKQFKPHNDNDLDELQRKAINITGWRKCYGSGVVTERHHHALGLFEAFDEFRRKANCQA